MPNEKLPLEFAPPVAEPYSPGILPALMMLSGGIADVVGVAKGRGLAGQRMQQLGQQQMMLEMRQHGQEQRTKQQQSKQQEKRKQAEALLPHLNLLQPEQQETANLLLQNEEVEPVRAMVNSALRQRQDRKLQLELIDRREAGSYKNYAKDRIGQLQTELKSLKGAQPAAQKAIEALRVAAEDAIKRDPGLLDWALGRPGDVNARDIRKILVERAGLKAPQASKLSKDIAEALNSGEFAGKHPAEVFRSGALEQIFYDQSTRAKMTALHEEMATLSTAVDQSGLIQTAITSRNPIIKQRGELLLQQLRSGQIDPKLQQLLQRAIEEEQASK